MKPQHIYPEKEADSLVDVEKDLATDRLIVQVKKSRRFLAIAEWDQEIFEEVRQNQLIEEERERSELLERKLQAELTIQYCQDNFLHPKYWLEKTWLRYGRPRAEALSMRLTTISQIKIALRRKISTKTKRMDFLNHFKNHMGNEQRRHRELWSRRFEHVLEKNKTLSIDVLRSNDISTAYFPIYTSVRQTRDVTILIGGQMTNFDALHEVINKFKRVENYFGDDYSYFERNLNISQQSILEQEKLLKYLASIANESAKGAYRAEKTYKKTESDPRKTEIDEMEMLADLHHALEKHRHLCVSSLKYLVRLNLKMKNSFSRQSGMKILPFHQSTDYSHIKSAENTELNRTFEILQDLTQVGTMEEVETRVQQQIDRCVFLELANQRLDYLLRNILHVEEKMFFEEYDSSSMSKITRCEVANKAIKTIHDTFDKKVTTARRIIVEQRDTADEFEFFLEILRSVNDRISLTFEESSQTFDIANQPDLDGLLTLIEINMLDVAVPKLFLYLDRSWDQLEDYVHHRDFLEHRVRNLTNINVSTRFDQSEPSLVKDEQRSNKWPSVLNAHYLTNAQVKEANWQMKEQSRLGELTRLRLASQKDKKEKMLIEKRQVREDAAAALEAKNKPDKKTKTKAPAKKPLVTPGFAKNNKK